MAQFFIVRRQRPVHGHESQRKIKGIPNINVIRETGSVAQVGHPTSLQWTPKLALRTLVRAAAKVPSSVELLIAGGGYVGLAYSRKQRSKAQLRQPAFLAALHAWTLEELSDLLDGLPNPACDLLFGVDVDVCSRPSGQFVAWLGRTGLALVPKRYPVGAEVQFLAGVDSVHPSPFPSIVTTRLGPTLVLVCHDAQVFNHRNQANVARARQTTPRTSAVRELHGHAATRPLAWALNAVHWVNGESNTRTFRISYDQLRKDFNPELVVAAGIGYGNSVRPADVPLLLDRMVAPRTLSLPKVIIFG